MGMAGRDRDIFAGGYYGMVWVTKPPLAAYLCCDYYLYCIVLRLALPRLTPFREGSLLVVLADTNAYYNVTIHGRHTFRWRDLRLLVLVAAALWLSICFYHIDLSSILNLSIEYRSPRIST